jgi:hypothetical protein
MVTVSSSARAISEPANSIAKMHPNNFIGQNRVSIFQLNGGARLLTSRRR